MYEAKFYILIYNLTAQFCVVFFMFWLLHMLLKYLSGPIFEIAVCMAGADILAVVLACFVGLKCSLICGYIISFMGGITLLHRAIHVHYDIDGWITDVPHLTDGELPFYR